MAPLTICSVATPAPSPVLAHVLPHGQMALQAFRLIPWRREKRVVSFLTRRSGCLQALAFLAHMTPPPQILNPPDSAQTQYLKPPPPEMKSPSVSHNRHGRCWTPLLETDERKGDHLMRWGQSGGSEGGVFIWHLNPIYFQKECRWRPPGPASLSCNACWTGMRSSSSQMKLS